MKILSLQLSNILSFRFVADVGQAALISFDDNLNIIIGENGAGKSTALEVINFLFRRVLFKQYNVNNDLYLARNNIDIGQRKQIVAPANHNSFGGFRLDPNWNSESQPQKIRIVLKLDQIDKANIQLLSNKSTLLRAGTDRYSNRNIAGAFTYSDTYTLDITLNRQGQSFTVTTVNCGNDFGFEYLTEYHFYKELIAIHNLENPADQIDPLRESFTLISSYRNYHAFNTSISLRDNHPTTQIRQIRSADFSRSLNVNDNSEPSIFALVRLGVAEKHFSLIDDKLSAAEREEAANDLPFITEINRRLRIVNLKCKIKLLDARTWQYSFEFLDLRRNKAIADINSLSAGQKAITHLVFESYGRGDLKGGVVIIDEPEIHLHYQFQHEYLQVIKALNTHQQCQYILVTHSEALINSETIGSVRRFSLSADGHSEVKVPYLTEEQKLLIRILDNTRSTYAFFAKKVVLVEGDTDRYFFKAAIQALYPELDQEIAVLHVGGKNELALWTSLFEKFGLLVYRIADFDHVYELFYKNVQKQKLKAPADIAAFKASHPDCMFKIYNEYTVDTYVLNDGPLEVYLGTRKDLSSVIAFCSQNLQAFLANTADPKSVEINQIIKNIVA